MTATPTKCGLHHSSLPLLSFLRAILAFEEKLVLAPRVTCWTFVPASSFAWPRWQAA